MVISMTSRLMYSNVQINYLADGMVVLIILSVQRVPSSIQAWVVGVVSPRWSTLIRWMSGLGWWSRNRNEAMYQEVVGSIPRAVVVGRFLSG